MTIRKSLAFGHLLSGVCYCFSGYCLDALCERSILDLSGELVNSEDLCQVMDRSVRAGADVIRTGISTVNQKP